MYAATSVRLAGKASTIKVRAQGVRRRLAAGTLAQARSWILEDARKYASTSNSQTREMLAVGKCMGTLLAVT